MNSLNFINKSYNKNWNSNKSYNNTDNSISQTKLNFNEICNFKMEINKLVEENIYLKTQLIEIKSKISQFENMLERTELKYQEQMNNYQKQIIKYNNYIHEVYLFFNNISNYYFPSLDFSLQNNEFFLINFEVFQSKLNLIEKFIHDLTKKKLNTGININNKSTNLLTEISFEKSSLEDRVNLLEKKIMNKGNKGRFKIPLNKNINNYSVRNKNNSYRMKLGIPYDNNICPKYFKMKQSNFNYNKIKNERLKTSFNRMDESVKKEKNKKYYNMNNKINNSTLSKKNYFIKPKRSLTPLTKQQNLFF